ncbi:MAG: ABC transporter ATP-binding protein [Kiritimatiellae bacterium]|nr:ABC transporter ATP-binding protein [Kiritimatiellia bacterium]
MANLKVVFTGAAGRGTVVAVDGVSFRVDRRESVGLVGESGSGKSTLASALLGLIKTSEGEIWVDGIEVTKGGRAVTAQICRKIQIVFQDSSGALNPRLTVGSALEEVLQVHRRGKKEGPDGVRVKGTGDDELRIRRDELLALVGLDPECASRYPHELSGGQRQRVGIARALAVEPELLIADEPVSALDVSVQAQILNLLKNLRTRMGLAYLLISHDLAVVRQMCERVMVMYMGRIVESAPVERLFQQPAHPYTGLLLSAVPDVVRGLKLRNAPPRCAGDEGTGFLAGSWKNCCAFWPRCSRATGECRTATPPVVRMPDGGLSLCHFAEKVFDERA